MKKLLALILAAFLLAPSVSLGAQRVGGYVTKKGRYVKPHYRSNKNRTQRDNWSSKGRSDPYTGKRGTKKPKW